MVSVSYDRKTFTSVVTSHNRSNYLLIILQLTKCRKAKYCTCLLELISIKWSMKFHKQASNVTVVSKSLKMVKSFICPIKAHTNYYKIVELLKIFKTTVIAPTCFGLHKPSSGSSMSVLRQSCNIDYQYCNFGEAQTVSSLMMVYVNRNMLEQLLHF